MKAMSRSLKFGKSVSDNGWGMFTTFLRYKLEEQGKKLVKVGRFFASSQTCSVCGYKNVKTKNLALREWDCPQCGTHHDRDVNAAINIRREQWDLSGDIIDCFRRYSSELSPEEQEEIIKGIEDGLTDQDVKRYFTLVGAEKMRQYRRVLMVAKIRDEDN